MISSANSGSCALLSFYDSQSKLLRVACTGDSRAILGRRSDAGGWKAIPLSVDQTAKNADEVARLRKEHPGEENVVRNGRVLGQLEPSRAFGDAAYKWTRETHSQLRQHRLFVRSQSPALLTPPYVTAEPVVTTTKVEPEKGDFMVLATDGLWDMLSVDEVVGLVGKWVDNKAKPGKINDKFTIQDKNAATHLARNALGGGDENYVSALLTIPSPQSRRFRDDITVQVVFFGKGPSTGDVAVNYDAAAGIVKAQADLKAKAKL